MFQCRSSKTIQKHRRGRCAIWKLKPQYPTHAAASHDLAAHDHKVNTSIDMGKPHRPQAIPTSLLVSPSPWMFEEKELETLGSTGLGRTEGCSLGLSGHPSPHSSSFGTFKRTYGLYANKTHYDTMLSTSRRTPGTQGCLWSSKMKKHVSTSTVSPSPDLFLKEII